MSTRSDREAVTEEFDIGAMLFGPDIATVSAARIGQRMTALYGCWEGRAGPDLVALTAGLLRPLEGAQQPLGQACLKVAAEVAAWGGHAYHSARHHAEVATNATVLAELAARAGQPLPRRLHLLLLAAALAHDFRYVPGQAPGVRFAAERVAADAMDEIARGCGVEEVELEELRLLILATEPGCRRHLVPGTSGGGGGNVPVLLAPLLERGELAGLAALLSDADLLSSAGLTVRWHDVQRARLERELGRPISSAEDAAFFDGIVGEEFLSVGGRHFTPNLQRIRASVL